MWKQIEKPRTMQATKALVSEFFNMEALPRDRPLSSRRLMIYQRILANGEFRPVTWASAFCKEMGVTYRVNGKHTSTLLHGVLDDLPEFFVTVERYECPTMEDVAKLYSTFDSNIGIRNASDIVLSFASTVKEFNQDSNPIAKKTLLLSVTAAAFAEWGLNYHSEKTVVERAELILDNVDFTLWLDEILWPKIKGRKQKDAAHIWRAPVAAAMYATWHKARGDSTQFWQAVRDESDELGSVTRVLAKWLDRSACRTAMQSKKPIVAFREMYVRCMQHWNAWRNGDEKIPKYLKDSKIPAAK